MLVIDPGMHTAEIRRASADRDGRWAVTGSDDKTIRVWSLADGSLARTIRVPAGPGNVGKVYAVAISPDGTLIAAGGWTRWTDADRQEQIYLFDRESGVLKQRIEGLPEVVDHLAFSPDGTRLAAVLGDGKGLRVYTSQDRLGGGRARRDLPRPQLRGGFRPRRRAGHHVLGWQRSALHGRAAWPDPARPSHPGAGR